MNPKANAFSSFQSIATKFFASVKTSSADSLEFLQAVLDGVPSFVWVKDESLRFLYVNHPLAALFHVQKGDMLGKKDEDFISDPDQLAHFRNDDRRVIIRREPLRISEEHLSDPTGRRLCLATTKVPLLLDSNQVYILGIATDITEIGVGTEVDKLRLAIISDIAHIIRSPIASAVLNLNAIERQLEDLKGRGHWRSLMANLTMIRASLLALDSSSKNFAKIAQGLYKRNSASNPEWTILNNLLQEQLNELKQILPTVNIAVSTGEGATLSRVLLDPVDQSLVKNAFYNIIYNAIKFSPPEAPIQINLKRLESCLILTVQDRGIGISEVDLPRVFDPGFTKRAPGKQAGSGMGLTIAKEVFNRLGWDISIASKQYSGTTVTITIPIAS